MALEALSKRDLLRQLNRSGIVEAVQASDVMSGFTLFMQSELPEIADKLEPLFVRHQVLVIKSASPAASQLLKIREAELLLYLNQLDSTHIERIQFRV